MKVNVPVQSQVDLSHLGESCRRSVNRTLYGNTDSAEVSRKVRSSGWALIQCDWCPYKKRSGHRHTQRDNHVRTRGEEGHLRASVVTKGDCSPTILGLEAGPGRRSCVSAGGPGSCLPGSCFPPAALALLGIPDLGLRLLSLCPVWAPRACGHSLEPSWGTSRLSSIPALPLQGVSLLHASSPPYLVNTP